MKEIAVVGFSALLVCGLLL